MMSPKGVRRELLLAKGTPESAGVIFPRND